MQKLATEMQQEVSIWYDGQGVGRHRPDLVVEGTVLPELKTVAALSKAHYARVRSCLKATGLPLIPLILVQRRGQSTP
jgi:GxxExxY protein